jgi:hypothetical protein
MYTEVHYEKNTDYLDPAQHDFLENLAFLWSKQKGKKISLSEVIRSAIELLKEKVGSKKTESETDAILRSAFRLEGIKKAREQKGYLSHEEVFGKK